MLQPSSRQRERGYFASEDGLRRLRERKSELGYTYKTIGDEAGVHFHTVRRLFNPNLELPVQMSTIQAIAGVLGLRPDDIITPPRTVFLELPSRTKLFGRTNELEQIQEYIRNQNCQLLSIIGMGGIGKTALLLQVIEQIKEQFDYIIGQSLQVPINLIDLLGKWLTFLNSRSQAQTDIPDNLGGRLTQLTNFLSNHRCLLVLDNLESIMQEGRVGYYCPEYQDYQKLLRLLFQSRHRSCLIITSRENPSDINYIENTEPVQILQLKGLILSSDIQRIFDAYGNFSVLDSNEWQQLVNYSVGGNPLMLKMLALRVRDMFNGDISQFIRQNSNYSPPTSIQDLLGAQFDRLSELDKEIVYWLSINREPVTLQELEQDIVTLDAQQNLCNSINSLISCSFIEKDTLNGYTLQPVIMQYVTQRFINQFVQELELARTLGLLNNYSLVKATKPDYIQHIQVNLFVKPILEQLTIRLKKNIQEVEIYLDRIREHLENESRLQLSLVTEGYAAANLLSLFRYLETQLNKYSFSHLRFRESDLRNLDLQKVKFKNSHFKNCLFSSPCGGILWVVFSQDGSLLAAGDVNGNIHIWRVNHNSENPRLDLKCTFTGHDGWIWTVRFILNTNNRYLVSAGDQHDIHI